MLLWPTNTVGSAMKSPCWNFLFCCFLLSNLQTTRTKKPVFQTQFQASIFLRSKRANTLLLEEILQGNLERECLEELCSKEEAREVFEDKTKTEAFWTKYFPGNYCKSSPCQHGGTCIDGIRGYSCNCTHNYEGPSCERDKSECPIDGPYACEHFCNPNQIQPSYSCQCAQGYKLHADKKSCIPQVKHPCGKLSVSTSTVVQKDSLSDKEICPHGHCPWQVTLVDGSGEPVCNGVILGPHAVLTSATCMTSNTDITHIHIGKNLPGTAKVFKLPFEAVPKTHSRFKPGHLEYDLCFLQLKSSLPLGGFVMPLCLPEKDFSENILMEDDKEGVISSGPVRHTYMSLDDCREHLNITFSLNNKMFCMKQHNLGTKNIEKEKQPPPDKREKVSASQSNQTSHENQARPRTQQTVWDNEDELFEYAEDLIPFPEVVLNSTVTPTEQSRRSENLTTESSPNQKGTPTPTPESLLRKTEKSSPVHKRKDDCEFLSGTPVASVKGKTAFLTGLMLTHDCRKGLVFTKLSRFLPWLESMLERQ